jgi:hypothetical protein
MIFFGLARMMHLKDDPRTERPADLLYQGLLRALQE